MMTFFILVVLLCSLLIYKRGSLKYYLLAGIFTGMGIATKYPAALSFIFVILVHLFISYKRNSTTLINKKIILGFFSVLLGFFICAPYFFLDFSTAKAQLTLGFSSRFLGAEGSIGMENYIWYLDGPLKEGSGIFISIFSLLGFLYSLVRLRNKDTLLLFSFPLIYFIILGLTRVRWDRWAIPILPFMAIFAALFLVKLINGISYINKKWHNRKKTLVFISSIILIIQPVFKTLSYDYLISQKDTRTVAKEWIDENITQGSKIAIEEYCPVISRQKYNVFINKDGILIKDISERGWKGSIADTESLDSLTKNGIEYVIINKDMYNSYLKEGIRYPDEIKFYQELFKKVELIKEFKPHSKDKPGPEIGIYRFKWIS